MGTGKPPWNEFKDQVSCGSILSTSRGAAPVVAVPVCGGVQAAAFQGYVCLRASSDHCHVPNRNGPERPRPSVLARPSLPPSHLLLGLYRPAAAAWKVANTLMPTPQVDAIHACVGCPSRNPASPSALCSLSGDGQSFVMRCLVRDPKQARPPCEGRHWEFP
jgi:hypothetical protein